jgi:uncharacterized protein (DUF1786 family)
MVDFTDDGETDRDDRRYRFFTFREGVSWRDCHIDWMAARRDIAEWANAVGVTVDMPESRQTVRIYVDENPSYETAVVEFKIRWC